MSKQTFSTSPSFSIPISMASGYNDAVLNLKAFFMEGPTIEQISRHYATPEFAASS